MTTETIERLVAEGTAKGFKLATRANRAGKVGIEFIGWGTTYTETGFYKTINGQYAATHRQ